MKRLFLIGACLGLVLASSGCATLSDAKIGKTLCENQFVSRAALNLKLAEDSKIKDAALRESAIEIDQAALAILNACPPPSSSAPVPVTVPTPPPAPNGSS